MSLAVDEGLTVICDGGRVAMHSDEPEELAEIVRANGRRYGYPECCIEEFVQDLTVRGILPAQHRIRLVAPSGRGIYIACTACQQRVTAGLFALGSA